jgi:peptide/nickel transport system substrate-binding protein
VLRLNRLRGPLVLLLALVAAIAIVGCGSSDDSRATAAAGSTSTATGGTAAETGGTGGVLRIGMTAGNLPFPNTPPNEGFEGRRFVGYQIYDALFAYNLYQGDTVPVPEPALAESYEISDDELTWTFKLRQDVVFHDGTTFDAEDVIFNFRRVRDKDFEYYDATLAGTAGSSFATIASWEMIDQYTVSITTVRPNAFLPYDLVYIYFASPEVVMEYGNDQYINHASGTGPFKMTKYVDGQVMELTANDDYWRGRPALDQIILYPMPEPATRLAALQAGDIDWAELPPPDTIDQLRAQDFQVSLKNYPHVIVYYMNLVTSEPLSDLRVRQALVMAADREGVSTLINNVGEPIYQYFSESSAYYDPTWEGYRYDPEKAKELLAEAGYADGLTLKLAYPTGGSGNMFPGPMNEKLKQDYAAVGVTLELYPLEWNNIITAYREGFANPSWADYDMLYFSNAPLSPTFARAFVSDYIQPNGCCNPSNYSNAEVDALYKEAEKSFDITAQNAALAKLQSKAMQDVAAFGTVTDLNLRVLSPKVKGFVQSQSWFLDLTHIWMED